MNGADSDTPIEPATAASISEYVGATDIVAPLPSTSSGQKDEGPPSPSAVRASDVDWGLPPLRVDGDAGTSDEEGDRDGDHKPPHRSRSAMIERFSSLDPSNLQTLLSGGLDRFYGKYKNAWKENNLSFPTPEVHFDNLSYTVWLSNESPQAKSSIGGYFRGFVAPWRKLRTVKKVILHPMTGIIQPGTLTLILANPGAGKSSFLKALIGKISSRKGLRSVKGTVSFSGLLAEEINVSKLVGLIDQIDNHFPTLTVRETINFADQCLNGPPESQPPKLREVARLRTELCLHILGLSKCADTVVGDALLRGVSGGERKRVTLGEMLVGGQSVFLCDEISTGLDSAAIFDIVKSLRSWTRALGGSAVVALLQPPPQVVDLFDDILVLAEGRLVYHGARVDMLPYFASLGFTCPQRVDPAEFVCDVVSGLGAQFLDHPDVADGARTPLAVAKPPRRASQFEECFQNSQIYRRTLALMAEKRRSYLEMQNEAELKSVAHLIDKHSTSSAYRNSFFGATRLLLARQQKIWFRDHALVASKLIEAVCVGILLGVIYLNVTTKLYLRMLFFTIAIFQRQAWQQITVSFLMRPVFYKQRSRNFFRTLSYTIAESLVQIPLNLAVSITIVVIFYFMSGLSRDGSTFIKFYIIIVSFQHAISAYFTLLASLAPSVTIAQALASLSVSFFLLFSGNIILPNLIPDYWIWMYWFNPVAWTLRAVLLNEFHDSRHSEAERKKFLDQFQVNQGPNFIWIAIIVLLLYYVLFTLLNTAVLRYIHYESTSTAAQAPLSAEDHYSPEETKRAHAAAQHTIKKVVRRGSASLRTGASIESRASSSESADKGSVDHVVLHVPPHESKEPDSNGGTAPGSPSPAACIPAYLAVRDLNYFVPNPANLKEELQLLHSVTASFAPGTMTALMGSSGAGKTTFMDVLAGRKTGGRIVGDIRVNGEAKDPATFSRIAGYCEQMDIHSGGASIMEALEFSATLRLPASTSEAEHRAVVDGAMDLLELRPLAKELVRNCSVEQKKRITIGVEMVANPSLLFLDEPTSGLDARAASIVMKGVLSIARTGRTVICTIHQPSKQIFELFDSLLLLQKGGYTAYFGELGHDSVHMLEYFSSIPGTAAMPAMSNPATYMLEVIGAGIGRGQARDYSVEYANSALCAANKAKADRAAAGNFDDLNDSKLAAAMVPFSTLNLAPIATGFPTQFRCCVWKMTMTYWRNPQYNLMRMVSFPVYAVIFGSTFYKLKESTVATVSSHVGLMYNTLDFIGIINLMTVLDTVTTERAVFYRERMSNYYGPLPYALSLFLAELPYLIIISFIFINVEYWMVGWDSSAWGFFLFWFVFFLHVSICTTTGQFMSVLMPNIKVANVAVGAVSVFFNLFSGFLMPHPQMRTFYSWIRYLVVTNYSLESIVSIELGHCDDDHPEWHGCSNMTASGQVTGKLWKYIDTNFDFRVDRLGRNIGVLLGFWAALQIAIYLTLRFVSHLKR